MSQEKFGLVSALLFQKINFHTKTKKINILINSFQFLMEFKNLIKMFFRILEQSLQTD